MVYCCNPFLKQNHKNIKIKVYPINAALLLESKAINIHLKLSDRICCTCRLQLSRKIKEYNESKSDNSCVQLQGATSASLQADVDEPVAGPSFANSPELLVRSHTYEYESDITMKSASESGTDMSDAESEIRGSTSDEFFDISEAIVNLNNALINLSELPIEKNKIRYLKYAKEKCDVVLKAIATRIFNIKYDDINSSTNDLAQAGEEMLAQFKEKYKNATSAEKMQILTSLPKSWSEAKVVQQFSVSFYQAHKAKTLQTIKGVMSTSTQKLSTRNVSEQTVKLVEDFYRDDEFSRVCPGKKDYVFIMENGEKRSVQTRMVLMNLHEMYEAFKAKHPSEHIGFTKFTTLRPKECLLAMEKGGMHNVCVCTYHQNIKLIFEPLRREKLFPDEIKEYQDLLKKIICFPPSDKCYLNICEKCPPMSTLHNVLQKRIDEKGIDNFSFKQWVLENSKSKNKYYII